MRQDRVNSSGMPGSVIWLCWNSCHLRTRATEFWELGRRSSSPLRRWGSPARALQYMPVHPRISGQEWNVQVLVTPVIPKLIKGTLFE